MIHKLNLYNTIHFVFKLQNSAIELFNVLTNVFHCWSNFYNKKVEIILLKSEQLYPYNKIIDKSMWSIENSKQLYTLTIQHFNLSWTNRLNSECQANLVRNSWNKKLKVINFHLLNFKAFLLQKWKRNTTPQRLKKQKILHQK